MITYYLSLIWEKLGIPGVDDIISAGKVSKKVGKTLDEASSTMLDATSTMRLVRIFIYVLSGVLAFLLLVYIARLIWGHAKRK